MRKIHALIILTFFLGGCVTTNFNLATQQQDYSITSTEREVNMGRNISKRVEEDFTVTLDEPIQDKVRDIGARLVAVCDRKELVYKFTVIDEEHVNAFALPGGYVYVTIGLIEESARDDELAGVIAHEIAHIAARHSVKRYEVGIGAQLLQLATIATRQTTAAQGVGFGMQAAQLAYARDDELEADRLGVKYMQEAGFDPNGMLSFLKTLHELDKEHTTYMPRGIVRPQYARSHPFVAERIRVVKEEIYGVADYIDYLNSHE